MAVPAKKILAIVLRPYDASIEETFELPPGPFGTETFGPESEYSVFGFATRLFFAESTYRSRPGDMFPLDVSPFSATLPTPPASFGSTPFGPELESSMDFPAAGLQSEEEADSVPFDARLLQSLNFQNALWDGDEPSGSSRSGFGLIEVSNKDGKYDEYLHMGWNGREVRMFRGDPKQAFSTWELVFVGQVQNIEWDELSIKFTLRDPQERLRVPLQPNLYTGTGGLEGDTDVQGQPKPFTAGRCRNIPPTLINATNLIYQVHDGLTHSIDAVRDKGLSLTPTGADYPTYEALLAATVGVFGSGADIEEGEYATCLAFGLFKLGGSPAGRVTADVRGDAIGGYVDRTAQIIHRIATTRLGPGYNFQYPQEFDVNSFDFMNVLHPWEVGYFANTPVEVGTVFDELMRALGAVWSVTLLGRLILHRIAIAIGAVSHTLNSRQIGSPLERRGPVPCYRRRLGYDRVWVVQSSDELGAVTDADRALYSTQYRYVVVEAPDIKIAHRNARDVTVPGFFVNKADAEAALAMQAEIFCDLRSIYSVPVDADPFALELNDTVALQNINRFDFGAEKKFALFGLAVDVKLGTVKLELLA